MAPSIKGRDQRLSRFALGGAIGAVCTAYMALAVRTTNNDRGVLSPASSASSGPSALGQVANATASYSTFYAVPAHAGLPTGDALQYPAQQAPEHLPSPSPEPEPAEDEDAAASLLDVVNATGRAVPAHAGPGYALQYPARQYMNAGVLQPTHPAHLAHGHTADQAQHVNAGVQQPAHPDHLANGHTMHQNMNAGFQQPAHPAHPAHGHTVDQAHYMNASVQQPAHPAHPDHGHTEDQATRVNVVNVESHVGEDDGKIDILCCVGENPRDDYPDHELVFLAPFRIEVTPGMAIPPTNLDSHQVIGISEICGRFLKVGSKQAPFEHCGVVLSMERFFAFAEYGSKDGVHEGDAQVRLSAHNGPYSDASAGAIFINSPVWADNGGAKEGDLMRTRTVHPKKKTTLQAVKDYIMSYLRDHPTYLFGSSNCQSFTAKVLTDFNTMEEKFRARQLPNRALASTVNKVAKVLNFVGST